MEFWSQFADLVQVIFLDQRGCGRSDASLPETWNLEQWADDVVEFCHALDINKPIIAGVSMGGHVMSALVSKYSEFPGGLIFCNTESRFPLELVCKKTKALGGELAEHHCRKFYTEPTLENLQEYVRYCIPYYAKNAYTPTELNRCIKHPEVFIHYCKTQMLQFDFVKDMSKIHCPTLLMVGRNSLHVVEAAEEMAKIIDSQYLTMKVFEHSGAPVYKDEPKDAYQTVKSFLQRL